MLEEVKPIILHTRRGTPLRVLRPFEFDAIREQMDSIDQQLAFDVLLFTGMRYVEFIRFGNNPSWVRDRTRSIYLPPEAQRKEMRVSPDRFIHLSSEGWKAIKEFFSKPRKIYTREGFNKVLSKCAKRADIDGTGLSAKSTRKTWESWLVYQMILIDRQPAALEIVSKSFGHTSSTAIGHYINLDFTKEDIQEITMRTRGWMQSSR